MRTVQTLGLFVVTLVVLKTTAGAPGGVKGGFYKGGDGVQQPEIDQPVRSRRMKQLLSRVRPPAGGGVKGYQQPPTADSDYSLKGNSRIPETSTTQQTTTTEPPTTTLPPRATYIAPFPSKHDSEYEPHTAPHDSYQDVSVQPDDSFTMIIKRFLLYLLERNKTMDRDDIILTLRLLFPYAQNKDIIKKWMKLRMILINDLNKLMFEPEDFVLPYLFMNDKYDVLSQLKAQMIFIDKIPDRKDMIQPFVRLTDISDLFEKFFGMLSPDDIPVNGDTNEQDIMERLRIFILRELLPNWKGVNVQVHNQPQNIELPGMAVKDILLKDSDISSIATKLQGLFSNTESVATKYPADLDLALVVSKLKEHLMARPSGSTDIISKTQDTELDNIITKLILYCMQKESSSSEDISLETNENKNELSLENLLLNVPTESLENLLTTIATQSSILSTTEAVLNDDLSEETVHEIETIVKSEDSDSVEEVVTHTDLPTLEQHMHVLSSSGSSLSSSLSEEIVVAPYGHETLLPLSPDSTSSDAKDSDDVLPKLISFCLEEYTRTNDRNKLLDCMDMVKSHPDSSVHSMPGLVTEDSHSTKELEGHLFVSSQESKETSLESITISPEITHDASSVLSILKSSSEQSHESHESKELVVPSSKPEISLEAITNTPDTGLTMNQNMLEKLISLCVQHSETSGSESSAEETNPSPLMELLQPLIQQASAHHVISSHSDETESGVIVKPKQDSETVSMETQDTILQELMKIVAKETLKESSEEIPTTTPKVIQNIIQSLGSSSSSEQTTSNVLNKLVQVISGESKYSSVDSIPESTEQTTTTAKVLDTLVKVISQESKHSSSEEHIIHSVETTTKLSPVSETSEETHVKLTHYGSSVDDTHAPYYQPVSEEIIVPHFDINSKEHIIETSQTESQESVFPHLDLLLPHYETVTHKNDILESLLETISEPKFISQYPSLKEQIEQMMRPHIHKEDYGSVPMTTQTPSPAKELINQLLKDSHYTETQESKEIIMPIFEKHTIPDSIETATSKIVKKPVPISVLGSNEIIAPHYTSKEDIIAELVNSGLQDSSSVANAVDSTTKVYHSTQLESMETVHIVPSAEEKIVEQLMDISKSSEMEIQTAPAISTTTPKVNKLGKFIKQVLQKKPNAKDFLSTVFDSSTDSSQTVDTTTHRVDTVDSHSSHLLNSLETSETKHVIVPTFEDDSVSPDSSSHSIRQQILVPTFVDSSSKSVETYEQIAPTFDDMSLSTSFDSSTDKFTELFKPESKEKSTILDTFTSSLQESTQPKDVLKSTEESEKYVVSKGSSHEILEELLHPFYESNESHSVSEIHPFYESKESHSVSELHPFYESKESHSVSEGSTLRPKEVKTDSEVILDNLIKLIAQKPEISESLVPYLTEHGFPDVDKSSETLKDIMQVLQSNIVKSEESAYTHTVSTASTASTESTPSEDRPSSPEDILPSYSSESSESNMLMLEGPQGILKMVQNSGQPQHEKSSEILSVLHNIREELEEQLKPDKSSDSSSSSSSSMSNIVHQSMQSEEVTGSTPASQKPSISNILHQLMYSSTESKEKQSSNSLQIPTFGDKQTDVLTKLLTLCLEAIESVEEIVTSASLETTSEHGLFKHPHESVDISTEQILEKLVNVIEKSSESRQKSKESDILDSLMEPFIDASKQSGEESQEADILKQLMEIIQNSKKSKESDNVEGITESVTESVLEKLIDAVSNSREGDSSLHDIIIPIILSSELAHSSESIDDTGLLSPSSEQNDMTDVIDKLIKLCLEEFDKIGDKDVSEFIDDNKNDILEKLIQPIVDASKSESNMHHTVESTTEEILEEMAQSSKTLESLETAPYSNEFGLLDNEKLPKHPNVEDLLQPHYEGKDVYQILDHKPNSLEELIEPLLEASKSSASFEEYITPSYESPNYDSIDTDNILRELIRPILVDTSQAGSAEHIWPQNEDSVERDLNNVIYTLKNERPDIVEELLKPVLEEMKHSTQTDELFTEKPSILQDLVDSILEPLEVMKQFDSTSLSSQSTELYSTVTEKPNSLETVMQQILDASKLPESESTSTESTSTESTLYPHFTTIMHEISTEKPDTLHDILKQLTEASKDSLSAESTEKLNILQELIKPIFDGSQSETSHESGSIELVKPILESLENPETHSLLFPLSGETSSSHQVDGEVDSILDTLEEPLSHDTKQPEVGDDNSSDTVQQLAQLCVNTFSSESDEGYPLRDDLSISSKEEDESSALSVPKKHEATKILEELLEPILEASKSTDDLSTLAENSEPDSLETLLPLYDEDNKNEILEKLVGPISELSKQEETPEFLLPFYEDNENGKPELLEEIMKTIEDSINNDKHNMLEVLALAAPIIGSALLETDTPNILENLLKPILVSSKQTDSLEETDNILKPLMNAELLDTLSEEVLNKNKLNILENLLKPILEIPKIETLKETSSSEENENLATKLADIFKPLTDISTLSGPESTEMIISSSEDSAVKDIIAKLIEICKDELDLIQMYNTGSQAQDSDSLESVMNDRADILQHLLIPVLEASKSHHTNDHLPEHLENIMKFVSDGPTHGDIQDLLFPHHTEDSFLPEIVQSGTPDILDLIKLVSEGSTHPQSDISHILENLDHGDIHLPDVLTSNRPDILENLLKPILEISGHSTDVPKSGHPNTLEDILKTIVDSSKAPDENILENLLHSVSEVSHPTNANSNVPDNLEDILEPILEISKHESDLISSIEDNKPEILEAILKPIIESSRHPEHQHLFPNFKHPQTPNDHPNIVDALLRPIMELSRHPQEEKLSSSEEEEQLGILQELLIPILTSESHDVVPQTLESLLKPVIDDLKHPDTTYTRVPDILRDLIKPQDFDKFESSRPEILHSILHPTSDVPKHDTLEDILNTISHSSRHPDTPESSIPEILQNIIYPTYGNDMPETVSHSVPEILESILKHPTETDGPNSIESILKTISEATSEPHISDSNLLFPHYDETETLSEMFSSILGGDNDKEELDNKNILDSILQTMKHPKTEQSEETLLPYAKEYSLPSDESDTPMEPNVLEQVLSHSHKPNDDKINMITKLLSPLYEPNSVEQISTHVNEPDMDTLQMLQNLIPHGNTVSQISSIFNSDEPSMLDDILKPNFDHSKYQDILKSILHPQESTDSHMPHIFSDDRSPDLLKSILQPHFSDSTESLLPSVISSDKPSMLDLLKPIFDVSKHPESQNILETILQPSEHHSQKILLASSQPDTEEDNDTKMLLDNLLLPLLEGKQPKFEDYDWLPFSGSNEMTDIVAEGKDSSSILEEMLKPLLQGSKYTGITDVSMPDSSNEDITEGDMAKLAKVLQYLHNEVAKTNTDVIPLGDSADHALSTDKSNTVGRLIHCLKHMKHDNTNTNESPKTLLMNLVTCLQGLGCPESEKNEKSRIYITYNVNLDSTKNDHPLLSMLGGGSGQTNVQHLEVNGKDVVLNPESANSLLLDDAAGSIGNMLHLLKQGHSSSHLSEMLTNPKIKFRLNLLEHTQPGLWHLIKNLLSQMSDQDSVQVSDEVTNTMNMNNWVSADDDVPKSNNFANFKKLLKTM